MGTVRAIFEAGPDESGDFHVHVESGRTRGALSVVLAVPREPADALGDALRDLHDPHGPIELDGRLGRLAGRAPEGTAFLVGLEDQVWVLPSARLRIARQRDGAPEVLSEP
ncbi:hypothetical protein K8I85_16620, partial [bacterium]|nr:hypothetical protein [bacterium]